MNLRKSLLASAVITATMGLTACGGSSSSDSNETPTTPAVTNSAPTAISLSTAAVTEDVVGAVVGTLSATDDDATGMVFTLSDDEQYFEINDSNELTLKSTLALNAEQVETVDVTVTATDAGDLSFTQTLSVSVTDIEAQDGVNVYEFASTVNASKSAVSYTGQVARHALSAQIKAYISLLSVDYIESEGLTGDAVKAQLMAYWSDYEAVKDNSFLFIDGATTLQQSFAEISSSGKTLTGKIAGNDASKMEEDWLTEGTFEGWSDFGTQAKTPEGLIFHYFDLIAANVDAIASGTQSEDVNGNDITAAYITTSGLDLNQLIQKHTLGALMFSQGTDDYLDEGLDEDNTDAAADGTYSTLEHQYDEGFGYFGAARHYLEFSDEAISDGSASADIDGDGKIDLASEYNWGNSTNAAKRDKGAVIATDFSSAAMTAFIAGRKIINDAAPSALTDDQKTQLLAQRDIAVANWENAIAATVVHYINDTLADIDTVQGTEASADDFANLAKHFSEMKGFALNFQFNPFSPFYSDDNAGKFAELHTLLGEAPLLTDAYKAQLVEARDLMQEVYGFDAQNVENW
ncbi:DUF4856 domain-containing protein [Pseudoalteromonas sp. R86517]|uniref:DUF4856 domain-containing protein n=1 Tax=Pseudoalteromonas sp. R86517 TaxID=3093857 RepID=UPI0036714240